MYDYLNYAFDYVLIMILLLALLLCKDGVQMQSLIMVH